MMLPAAYYTGQRHGVKWNPENTVGEKGEEKRTVCVAPHPGIARAFGVVHIAPMPPSAYRTYEFCVHPKILCVGSSSRPKILYIAVARIP